MIGKRLSAELHSALVAVLAANPGTIWGIGGLYDEVRLRLNRDVSLRAVVKAVNKLVEDNRIVVSWQIYGIRKFRLNENLA
jgi:hypothetical protein